MAAESAAQVDAINVMAEPVPEDHVEVVLASLGSGFGFLLDEFQIPVQIQAKMAINGFTEVSIFAAIDEEPAEVRKALRKDLGIDPDRAPALQHAGKVGGHVAHGQHND